MTTTITSLQNPLIKEVQRLQEKSRERRKSGLLVVEGRREVSLALASGYQAHQLLVCPDIYRPDPAYSIATDKLNTPVCEVSVPVYNKLAYRNDVEGILLVAYAADHSLESLKPEANPLILVLEQVEKPGNLGAMLRTCDAAGIDAVILCDPATDLYNPNTIRASLGCLFTQKIARASAPEVVEWLRKNNIRSFAAAPEATTSYTQARYNQACALIFGSESQGLSPLMMQAVDQQISIPMAGIIDSLNVSVSAAIIVFEAIRQRKTTS